MGTMTSWVIVHQLGDLAIYKINVFFVNKFWSTTESGALGAITDFGSYVLIVIGVITSLFGPIILIAFSQKDHEKVKKIVINNSLSIGLITTILVSLIISFSKEFLSLWLGKDFEQYSGWLILKLIDLPFYASAGIFAFVYRSWNCVKWPALITLIIGIFNIVVIYIICLHSNKDLNYINYILIFSAFCTFIQTYVLGGFMFKYIYPEISLKSIFIIPIKVVLLFLIIFVFSKITTHFYIIDKWYKLIFSFCVIGFSSLLITYFFMLSKNMKTYLFNELLKKDF
jgi:membrane protein EpsK